jgi:hypothetical protein
MKTIRNKTRRPLKVHLAHGKVLHLGPAKEGQISTHDIDHAGVQHLITEGLIEVLGEGDNVALGAEAEPGHADTHGHHPNLTVKKRGER